MVIFSSRKRHKESSTSFIAFLCQNQLLTQANDVLKSGNIGGITEPSQGSTAYVTLNTLKTKSSHYSTVPHSPQEAENTRLAPGTCNFSYAGNFTQFFFVYRTLLNIRHRWFTTSQFLEYKSYAAWLRRNEKRPLDSRRFGDDPLRDSRLTLLPLFTLRLYTQVSWSTRIPHCKYSAFVAASRKVFRRSTLS